MAVLPDLKKFCQLADAHDAIPVFRRLISDSLTPVSAFQKIDDGGTACLFESVVGGDNVGRYSFLGVRPTKEVSAFANRVTVSETNGAGQRTVDEFEAPNPLDVLRKLMGDVRVAELPGLPPFTGGAIGYAGYDVVRYLSLIHISEPTRPY